MGRLPRLQFPGACYHILLRGNNGEALFADDADCEAALRVLSELKERFGLKVYAYCLLESRVHLAVETPRANIARAMQGFGTAYTKYFNSRHRRAGHVFRGRYLSRLVEKGEPLRDLTRHIHLIPVLAEIVRLPWRYRWSSCRAYTEGRKVSALADTDAVLEPLGRSRLRQSVAYLKFLQGPAPASREDFSSRPCRTSGVPESAAEDSSPPVSDGRAEGIGGPLDIRSAIEEAARRHRISPEVVLSRLRIPAACRARREIALRAWQAGMKVAEIGTALRKTPSAVSRMVRQALETGKAGPPPNPDLLPVRMQGILQEV
jgi:putative transposase